MSPIIMNNLPNILGFITVTLFVFILIRELICWYFKVNEGIKLQKDILSELVKLNKPTIEKSTAASRYGTSGGQGGNGSDDIRG